MSDENKKEDAFEMIEVLEKATVVYTDGNKKLFDAIYITDKGVLFGRILKIDNTESDAVVDFPGRPEEKTGIVSCEKFVECGVILKSGIMEIKGGIKKTILKNDKIWKSKVK